MIPWKVYEPAHVGFVGNGSGIKSVLNKCRPKWAAACEVRIFTSSLVAKWSEVAKKLRKIANW